MSRTTVRPAQTIFIPTVWLQELPPFAIGVRVGQLERRHSHVALADRHVHRVTAPPCVSVLHRSAYTALLPPSLHHCSLLSLPQVRFH